MIDVKIGDKSLDAMSMGTWAIGGGIQWGDNDDAVSETAIKCAVESGITWIDTAPAYGFGHSEEIVGRALQGIREKVFLADKCGLQWYNDIGTVHLKKDGKTVYRDLSSEGLWRDLKLSLKRLDTDYIDLYLTHWQSEAEPIIPISETMGTLLEMKEQGYIRGIGVCNVTPDQVLEYLKYGKVDVVQQKYSMLSPDAAEKLIPICEENGIILQTYSPLEQGLLTDKANREVNLVPGNVRYHNIWWQNENRNNVISMLDGWKELCQKYDCAMSNLVIAWTMMRSPYFNLLCGARKPEQITENAAALNINLEKVDFDRMYQDINNVIAKKVTE